MQSGKLRHLVKIEERREMKDELGQMVVEWLPIAERYADVRPVSSKNMIVADRVTTGRQYTVKMRHVERLNESMRLVIGDGNFDIFSIMPDATLRRDVIVQCYEVINGDR